MSGNISRAKCSVYGAQRSGFRMLLSLRLHPPDTPLHPLRRFSINAVVLCHLVTSSMDITRRQKSWDTPVNYRGVPPFLPLFISFEFFFHFLPAPILLRPVSHRKLPPEPLAPISHGKVLLHQFFSKSHARTSF